ncbi:MAG: DUF2167 domain-containing protein [Gemmatimonadota bacterium]|nr:DUF2167 domain-containing protein [Gemmatimonadota bacterium]MDH5758069.1 DUF2167 domain-containing protein [Gemmatimonadota bacterium]
MKKLVLAMAVVLFSPWAITAQDSTAADDFEATLNYRQGLITIGDDLATLDVPEAFRFLGPEDARRLLVDGWGNPPMDPPLGMILPADLSPLSWEGWAVVITFEEDGYVEDDDASDIDYADLLAEMQSDTRESSDYRVQEGYPPIELVGWAAPPHYDADEHKLYWAKELAFGSEEDHTLNYNVRILGRRGVLVLNAVAVMDMMQTVEADMQSVMDFVNFNEGHRYGDFMPGADKVAAYGIAGLIAGKVAVKAGLFKVLIGLMVAMKKFVLVAVVAVAALVKKAMGGKGAESEA